MLKFNENRTFGIEIEICSSNESFQRITREEIARAINNKGIHAVAESYNHVTRPHWKITTDVSCGLEIVSPILKGRDGINQLEKVCEALNDIGAKVDKKCGVHIHHDVNDFQINNFKNLFKLYIKHEKNIDKIMPDSRKGNNNQYCGSLIKYSETTEQKLLKIDQCQALESIKYLMPSRYVKLNIQSYFKYGTIEFRQHSGTTDFEKIKNWLLLSQAMVEKAKISRISSTIGVNGEGQKGIDGLMIGLRIVRKDESSDELRQMRKFYLKREKSLITA